MSAKLSAFALLLTLFAGCGGGGGGGSGAGGGGGGTGSSPSSPSHPDAEVRKCLEANPGLQVRRFASVGDAVAAFVAAARVCEAGENQLKAFAGTMANAGVELSIHGGEGQ